jgi:hypothetical protein
MEVIELRIVDAGAEEGGERGDLRCKEEDGWSWARARKPARCCQYFKWRGLLGEGTHQPYSDSGQAGP